MMPPITATPPTPRPTNNPVRALGGGIGGGWYAVACWTCAATGVFFGSAGFGAAFTGVLGPLPGLDLVFVPPAAAISAASAIGNSREMPSCSITPRMASCRSTIDW